MRRWLCVLLLAVAASAPAAALSPCAVAASSGQMTLRLPAPAQWQRGGMGVLGASTLYFLDDDAFWQRPQVYAALRTARIGALRFPGGELADNYDWEHNALERPADWPGEAATAGGRAARTDYREFIAHAERTGATDLFLVVNLDGAFRAPGPRADNLVRYAAKAARWVAAVAQAKPHAAVHWEIGNEPYLGGSYPLTAREYAEALRIFAAAMRAVDPNAHIGAAGPGSLNGVAFADRLGTAALARLRAGAGNSRRACPGLTAAACIVQLQQGEPAPATQRWWPTVMALAGDSFDFAVIHRYARATPLRGTAQPLTQRLQRLRQGLHAGTGRSVPLALTEWNTPNAPRRGALSEIDHLLDIAVQLGNDAAAALDYTLYWPLRAPAAGHHPLLHDDGTPTAVAQLFALVAAFDGMQEVAQANLGGGVYLLQGRSSQGELYLVVNSGTRAARIEVAAKDAGAVSVQRLVGGAAGGVAQLQPCRAEGLYPSGAGVDAPARSISLIRPTAGTIRL